MRKKRIAHLSSAHTDRDDRIFYKECVSLAQDGFEVHLVLANVEERIEMGVQVHSVQTKTTGRLNRMWKTVNAVYQKALEIDADLYHLHDPELLRIAKKLKRKGKKVIYDVHEDLPRQIMGKDYIKFKKQVSRMVERYENKVSSKLDGIIAATPFIRDRFLKVNTNSIDINNFPILAELYSEEINSSKPGNVICYVGGITKERGIVELIKCLEYVDARLALAGSFTPESLKEELTQLAAWKKVDYKGFLNRAQVKELYSQVTVGMVTLHPLVNYLDSLPVKMFEYMISGLPIICSDFLYWKGIIEKNECGLCVDPFDVKATANAIQYLLDRPEEAKAMGQRGRKLVLEQYNWDIEKKKLNDFYQKTLSL